jgi:hypothetical protein
MEMAENTCDENTSAWNQARTRAERPGKKYVRARVDVVAVDASNNVTVRARGTDGQPRTVTFPWTTKDDRVWLECPSTLTSAASPPSTNVPPAVGESGILYLEEILCKENAIVGDPKWPDRLLDGVYKPLPLWPIKLTLTAINLANGITRDINLLDPKFTAPDQDIVLHGGTINLLLSQTGFGIYIAEWTPDIDSLRVAVELLESQASSARERAAAWDHVATLQEWLENNTTRKQPAIDAPNNVLIEAGRLLDRAFNVASTPENLTSDRHPPTNTVVPHGPSRNASP